MFEQNLLKLPYRKRLSLGWVLIALFISGTAMLHKFYVSLTEIRYNNRTECFEVSMRIFPDDLDRALLERTGMHTRLATELEPPGADSLLKIYLMEHFAIRVDGVEIALNYLGKEPEGNAVWCYLESAKVPEPLSIYVRNTLLTEFFPDQVNIIQVYREKWNKGMLLNRNQQDGTLAIGE